MGRSRYSIGLIIVLLLAGCSQRDTVTPQTPTPFTTVGATFDAPIGEPIPVALDHLAANPELFEGAILHLTGQYQALPTLICEQRYYPSPATWGIVSDGLMANATGHDRQLSQLLAQGQEVTAEGRWLHYTGPVGCGKSATVQDVWYLSLNRIVEPHPLARATAPAAIPTDAEVIAEVPTTEAPIESEEPPDLVQTATLDAAALTVTPTLVPSPTQPGDTGTAQPAVTPSLVPSPITTKPSGTATAVTPGLTPTPTGSGTPVDGSVTPTSTTTPGPTATISNQAPEDKGLIDFEDLVISSLQSGAVDIWSVDVDSSNFLTITIAPSSSANIVFSVLDENEQIVVDRQDQAPAGAVESITDLSARETGRYQIQVSTDPPESTEYALMVMDNDSYNFEFRGTLEPGTQRSDSLSEENDHFWFFSASDSETISLQVTPNDSGDAYVELYGPDGSRLLSLDDEDSGTAESLDNHSILATGMYGIRIGEFDFGSMSYRILVNKT